MEAERGRFVLMLRGDCYPTVVLRINMTVDRCTEAAA